MTLRSFLLGCATCATLAAAENPGAVPTLPDVVKMSPYEVRALSVDFRRWIKVGSPNFILYTDASGSEASQVLRELEMLHAAARYFFGRNPIQRAPAIIVLPTSGSDWRKLEAKGRVEWRAAISQEGEMVRDVIVVQYDWQSSGTYLIRWAQAYVEAKRANLHGPFWFERGLQTFFTTAEFSAHAVDLGRASTRMQRMERRGWLPWDRFFRVTPESPEFRKEGEIDRYEGQCATFIQFLFANPDHSWHQRLNAWVDYLNGDHEPTEPEFKRFFGQDWKEWQRTMDRYMSGGAYAVYQIRLTPEQTKVAETKYPQPVREMRDLFILSQILVQDVPASGESLDAMLAEGLKTESLREVLAAACIRRHRHGPAREQLQRLIDAKTTNPLVYVAASALRFVSDPSQLDINYRLHERADQIRIWCSAAVAIEPMLEDANQMLAWAEALAPEVDQQSIFSIEECYRRMRQVVPSDDIIAALAVAQWRLGDDATARALAEKLRDPLSGSKLSRQTAADLLTAMAGH